MLSLVLRMRSLLSIPFEPDFYHRSLKNPKRRQENLQSLLLTERVAILEMRLVRRMTYSPSLLHIRVHLRGHKTAQSRPPTTIGRRSLTRTHRFAGISDHGSNVRRPSPGRHRPRAPAAPSAMGPRTAGHLRDDQIHPTHARQGLWLRRSKG